MKRIVRPQSSKVAPDVLGRRQFLSGVLLGGAGSVAMASGRYLPRSLPKLESGQSRGDLLSHDVTIVDTGEHPEKRVLFGSYGPDGLPVSSISGTYVGADGSAIVVSVKEGTQEVTVVYSGSTEVLAHGYIKRGDVSQCEVGDFVQLGTFIDMHGQRHADYVNANPLATWGLVRDVTEDQIGLDISWGSWWQSGMAQIMPYTRIYALGSFTAEGTAVLAAGDTVYFTAMLDSPTTEWSECWAVQIRQSPDFNEAD